MSTEQSYVGRGNNPYTTPQTGENAPPTPPLADNRPPVIPAITSECVEVNRAVYEAQTRLLELVDDFTACGAGCGPVEVINDLLYRWLTTSPVDLSYEHDKGKLRMALLLVDFLTDLRASVIDTNWTIEAAKKQKGGLGHE